MRRKGSSVLLVHPGLSRSLDRLSSRIVSPAEKLRFIKRTLSLFERVPGFLRRLPLLRGLLFHYIALEVLSEILRDPRRRGDLGLPALPLSLLYRLRHGVLAACVVALVAVAGYAGAVGYAKGREGAGWLVARFFPPATVTSETMLPPGSFEPRRGRVPERVWLVEEDENEQLWSNGLRIDTRHETSRTARSYFAFPRDGSPPIPMGVKPAGIVYHASESDMEPLTPELSRDILSTTRDLVGWLSRRDIYHYIIDRFGQVYRIVSDDSVAVHAGFSIWGDESFYYLNLNDSFLGVAFESRWSAGGDVVTSAQLQAAANLTDLLRARYEIPDANCVPHGLVSVNASKGLIGYHTDWARNFPFDALGLSDKYDVPPPSITGFGFGYDSDLAARLGGSLWPGIVRAEDELARQAEAAGVSVETLRARLRQRYREHLELAKLGAEHREGLAAARRQLLRSDEN